MTDSVSIKAKNRRLLTRMLVVVVGMFGFGFALVPLYDVFCEITGINGKADNQAAQAKVYQVDTDRWVTVEFLASVNQHMPWEFRPVVNKMRVHPGQAYVTSYVARNSTNRAMTGQAVPSVSPGPAAKYLDKTECFCFENQQFGPGERREMPLHFIIDPALPEKINTVSLSYTFFDVTKSKVN